MYHNHKNSKLDKEQHNRTIIAVVLCVIVMFCWQVFYEAPLRKQQEQARKLALAEKTLKEQTLEKAAGAPDVSLNDNPKVTVDETVDNREEIIATSPRIKIDNGALHGSIRLVGARFDDLTLAYYKQSTAKNSPEVVLMSPSGTKDPNFIDTGWIGNNLITPTANTTWQIVGNSTLTADAPVTLTWDNGQGLIFTKKISVDKFYMFTVEDSVKNSSPASAQISSYGLISKTEKLDSKTNPMAFIHTGAIGVMNKVLEEISYGDLRDDGDQSFEKSAGWLGFSDQYWMKAIAPQGEHKSSFKYSRKDKLERFQADYVSDLQTLAAGETLTTTTQIFAGAKRLNLLEDYSEKYGIPLLDRGVHFGSLYFLSKPFTHLLNFFFDLFGNFGLAIFGLTFCVKLALFPLARKSYVAMGKLKVLHPKIKDLQTRHKEDKMAMQKAMLELYKKEKVNPASGCLPILLQIPIFIALYRVFLVNIDMRHAPFFGWVHDLSAPDPTSWWNLFGLLPFQGFEFMAIGIWPIIMTITMYIQQFLTPTPTDPTQNTVMKLLPLLFLFMFHSFPVGLIIYWCFSNTLTVLQQLYFLKVLQKKH